MKRTGSTTCTATGALHAHANVLGKVVTGESTFSAEASMLRGGPIVVPWRCNNTQNVFSLWWFGETFADACQTAESDQRWLPIS